MAKIELNEKNQIKANVYFKKIDELENYKAALDKKQAEAKAEIGTLQDQLKSLTVDYFTVIDEVSASTINNKRKVIKDRIADLEMVLQMDVKGIIREKVFKDGDLKNAMDQSQKEYFQFRDEIDRVIAGLNDEIDKLEFLQRSHKHLDANTKMSVLRSTLSR